MYKVAISDLDGTLLGPDHKLSVQTKDCIHHWLASGRKFVIATGRHYIEANTLQKELGEALYLITSNGARVHNKQGEVILKQNLSSTIANEICNMNFADRVQINLFTDSFWYANFRLPELDAMALNQAFTCQVTNLKTLDKSDTIKIFFCAKAEVLQSIYQQLKQRFAHHVNLTFSLPQCLEVMDANANKGSATQAVLAAKEIRTEQAIAFGDAMNDVEMLNLVGKPILMANSQNRLRQALPDAEMTLSAQEHGVANKLAQLLD